MRLAGSRIWSLSLIAILVVTGTVLPAFGAAKSGSACKKVEQVRVVKGISLKCTKVGKRQVWRKVAAAPVVIPAVEVTPSPSPSPTPTPPPSAKPTVVPPTYTLPTSFNDLYENRQGISFAAWKRTWDVIAKTPDRGVQMDLEVGPTTKLFYEDYVGIANLVARAFPNHKIPPKTLVFLFNYADIEWAESKLKDLLDVKDFEYVNEFGRSDFIRGNCKAPSNCTAARQSTGPSKLSIIAHGVPTLNPFDSSSIDYFSSGQLEAHEFFHGLQNLYRLEPNATQETYPHTWFAEGGAQWVQNVIASQQDFQKYLKFSANSCVGSCRTLTESDISEFLTVANGWIIPERFGNSMNYSLGGAVIEILVAVAGQDSILDIYKAMFEGLNFGDAFEKVYGIAWKKAIPIIAKTLYSNLNSQ
jgi:hypothetical protein